MDESSRQPFLDVVANVATNLEHVVALLRTTIADEIGSVPWESSASLVNVSNDLKMDFPMASVPFTPGRSPSRARTPQTSPRSPEGSVLPPDVKKYDGVSDLGLSMCQVSSVHPETEFGTASMSSDLGLRSKVHVHEAWSQFDDNVVNEYLGQLKQKPNLQARSSAGNLSFYAAFYQRKYTSTSSVNLFFPMLRWAISPLSTWRLVWDFASIIFLLNDVLMVPLQVFDVPDSVDVLVIEICCRLFWMGDIIMSFRTGFYDAHHEVEMRASRVARNYLRTWFPIDLCILMVDWLKIVRDSDVIKTMQLVRLARLYKLLRLRRMIIERSNSNRVHLYLDCIDGAVGCAMALHWISCGWYWLGEQVYGWTHEDHMQGADLIYSYFAAARWTIAQVSGRTDIELRTAPEYIYTCCVCVFGLIIMALMISIITNTYFELNALNRDRSSKSRALNGFLRRSHVVASLAIRTKAVLNVQQKIMIHSEKEAEVLSLLPKQIMSDLLFEIRGPVLMCHKLFDDLGREFPRMLRRVCADGVKTIFVSENEVAFAKGDACTRMLFVVSGCLEYTQRKTVALVDGVASSDVSQTPSPRSEKFAFEESIKARQWLSEAALWVEWEHRGNLRGSELSSLAALEVQEFINVVKLFRWAKARSVMYAKAFVEKLSLTPNWSDVMEPITEYIEHEPHEVVTQTPVIL